MIKKLFTTITLIVTLTSGIAGVFTPVFAANLPSTPTTPNSSQPALGSSQTVPNTGSLPTGGTGINTSNPGLGISLPGGSFNTSPGIAKSTAANFTGCFTQGALTDAAQKAIQVGIQAFSDSVQQMAEGQLKNFLGGILGGLGGGGFLGNVPVSDPGTQKGLSYIFSAFTDQNVRNAIIERCAAWSIMTAMTNNTYQLLRTAGRDGGATYIENWNNFQLQSQYRGENIFRAELSTANLCGYFSDDLKKAYGVSPSQRTTLAGQNVRVDSLQPFSLQTNCTMPVGFNPTAYSQNFAANGGWDTYSTLLQPQNNPIGAAISAQDEVKKQRNLQESTDVNQALANNGYLGISGYGSGDSCSVMGPNGQCLVYKKIRTPGSYIAQSAGAAIGAQFAWLTTAQGLNTIIGDATDVMLHRLFNLGSSDEGNYHAATDGNAGTQLAPPSTNNSAACVSNCITSCVAGGGSPLSCPQTCSASCANPAAGASGASPGTGGGTGVGGGDQNAQPQI